MSASNLVAVPLTCYLPASATDRIAQIAQEMGMRAGRVVSPPEVVECAVRVFLGMETYDRTHLMWETHRRKMAA